MELSVIKRNEDYHLHENGATGDNHAKWIKLDS